MPWSDVGVGDDLGGCDLVGGGDHGARVGLSWAKTGVRKTYQTVRLIQNTSTGATGAGVIWGLAGGGDCGFNTQEMMIVCSGMDRLHVSGGTTAGSTFVTYLQAGAVDERLMAREAKHADQCLILGWTFPSLYAQASAYSWIGSGKEECNVFEQWAGFEDGGYKQCL